MCCPCGRIKGSELSSLWCWTLKRWMMVQSEHCCGSDSGCHLGAALAAPLGSSGWTGAQTQQLKPWRATAVLLEAGGAAPALQPLQGLPAPLPRIPESPALSSKAPLLIRAGGKESSGLCSEQELIKIQKVISLRCPLITGNPGRPDQT